MGNRKEIAKMGNLMNAIYDDLMIGSRSRAEIKYMLSAEEFRRAEAAVTTWYMLRQRQAIDPGTHLQWNRPNWVPFQQQVCEECKIIEEEMDSA